MSRAHCVVTRQRSLTALIHGRATEVVVHFTGGWADYAIPLVQRVVLKRTGKTLCMEEPEYDELERTLADLLECEHRGGPTAATPEQ
jgi:hypothetical protein